MSPGNQTNPPAFTTKPNQTKIMKLTQKQEIGRKLLACINAGETVFAIYTGKKLAYYYHENGRLEIIACEIPRVVSGCGSQGDASKTAASLICYLPAEEKGEYTGSEWPQWVGGRAMQILNLPN